LYKRIAVVILIVLISFTISSLAHAQETDNIYDYLDYLSSDNILSLQGEIDRLKSKHGLDIAIVITDDTEGKSSRDYADDFYDYNGFGLDDQYSGLLLLINMDIREIWISTTGMAIRIFTDYRIDRTLDRVASYLSDGDYYMACSIFLSSVDAYAQEGVPKGQYNYDTETGQKDYYDKRPVTYTEKAVAMMKSPKVYIVAAALALFTTLMLSKSSKGKQTTNKLTYEQNGSFTLRNQRDQFIRQSTSQVMISSSSSSRGGGGGRSSTHRGSSGRSHGGGGRRF